jgi:hypothetical protein
MEWLARGGLAVVFVAAAVPKILDPGEFALAVYRYRLLPPGLVSLCAVYLPWIELCAAVGLLGSRMRRGSALILILLLSVFTLAIIANLSRGIDIACGCFSVGGGGGRAGWLGIARNLGLMLPAALALRK